MKIISFQAEPVFEFRYLNAGRGPGQFYEDRLPVHVARVDRLPEGLAALIATADLQGRERFEDSPGGPLRLLGEALPERLTREVLPALSLPETGRIGVLLAGDFYTVPALDKRGGSGDVTGVWRAFADDFAWVAGIPGNHDTFGEHPGRRPRFPARMHYLDGDATEISGMRIAGLGGIIGNAARPHRRSEADYLATLRRLLVPRPDLVLMHDGPDGPDPGQRGLSQVREILQESEIGLVIRGHAHWPHLFAEFEAGLQILNVDARVVILAN
jgi:hypothetical protein